jgi:hypothetical protein
MSFRSDDQLFSSYDGQYIEMFVNGVRKKFYVQKTNNFSLLSGTKLLDPIVYDYSFIKVSDEQSCGKMCIKEGISIRAIYSSKSVYNGYANPCADPHNCNAARYTMYANNVLLGDVNLDNFPSGDDRETQFILTAAQATQIKAVHEKIITFNLVCNVGDNPPKGTNGSLGPGVCHETMPWILITSNTGAILYSGCPSQNEFIIELMCV